MWAEVTRSLPRRPSLRKWRTECAMSACDGTGHSEKEQLTIFPSSNAERVLRAEQFTARDTHRENDTAVPQAVASGAHGLALDTRCEHLWREDAGGGGGRRPGGASPGLTARAGGAVRVWGTEHNSQGRSAALRHCARRLLCSRHPPRAPWQPSQGPAALHRSHVTNTATRACPHRKAESCG